jgi:2-(1,2-epoxy-1,2-dihydrophenyl)acetyl-CoA isomerase
MDETGSTVDYEVEEGIAWVHLARPDRLNAVVPKLVDELCAALQRAADEDVGALVLAGRGRAFCAGFDLKHDRGDRTELGHRRQLEGIQDVTRLIRRVPFAVVTAVQGYALGNGCEFALAGDVVLAAEDAAFGFPEVSYGLSVTGGISTLLVQAVGQYRAKDLLLFGERFTAHQALEWGLVSRVVPAPALRKEAEKAARTLASRPRAALVRAKRAIDLATSAALETAYAIEIEQALVAGRSSETQQAIGRFGSGPR